MSGPSDETQAPEPLSGGDVGGMRRDLLDWYDRHRRDLPWRGVDDPYKTWVAEMMLQQTRVSTVVDYYERWMERFPDVESVADAEVDDVLELWEGLGYYRRARFLHRSARKIVGEYGGELPSEADELEELVGVGPYTAGAIASIAFDRPTPVVDGNVSRVLARLHAIEGDPTDRANEKVFWELAGEMVDSGRPGDFNQAMMELGATVCTPQGPSCLLCPVREHCRAFAKGDPEAYPDTASRARQKPVDVVTCPVVADRSGSGAVTYVVKRDADGLLGGLWEFPTARLDEEDEPGAAVDELLADEPALHEAVAADGEDVGELTHLFSHLRMSIRIRTRYLDSAEPDVGDRDGLEDRGAGWLSVDALDEIAMSTAMRRVEREVFEGDDQKS